LRKTVKLSSTVQKGMRVLEAFDARNRTLTLAELTEATKLDKSAVIRLTQTFLDLGYLRRNPKTKRFRLSPRILSFGVAYLGHNPLVAYGMPRIQKLASQTGLQAELSELDGTEAVVLASAPGRKKLSDVSAPPIGVREPAFVVSPGRAILSHLPREETRAVVTASQRRKFTRHTRTGVEEILELFGEFARLGYSWNDREHNPIRVGIGAPVFDFTGLPIAAISITTDVHDHTLSEARRRFAPLVVATAKAITLAYQRSD
jgi:IclR family transcriptional regulator, pca regulon regulatory protein